MSNLCGRAGCRGCLGTVQDSDRLSDRKSRTHSLLWGTYLQRRGVLEDEAINRAKANAWETVWSKFHGVGQMDIDWDIREERAPMFVRAEREFSPGR
jgi:hypothetical protein